MFLVSSGIHLGYVELATSLIQYQCHVFNQLFVLNLAFDWVVDNLNTCLKNWRVVEVCGRGGGWEVGWPVATGEVVKIVLRVVERRWGVGDVGFNRGGDPWSERGKWELDGVDKIIVGGLGAEVVIAWRYHKWFGSGQGRRARMRGHAMKERFEY